MSPVRPYVNATPCGLARRSAGCTTILEWNLADDPNLIADYWNLGSTLDESEDG